MYLLDTNACIAIINGKPVSVRNRLAAAVAAGDEIFVSTIVGFELWYGVAKSDRPKANAQLVQAFLNGPLTSLTFEDEDARVAGDLRAKLEAAGKPIGAYDLLIAGQAIRHKFVLITANSREFARVPGLQWDDWTKH
jgi:tRNA(fMet)-specific endonuclease VapC